MKLSYNPAPSASEQKDFEDKLLEFNGSKIKNYNYDDFIFKIENDAGKIIAGTHCRAGGGWLYIASLWVEEDFWGTGLGTRLLNVSEAKAKMIGCHGAYLYTYSFMTSEFYQKNGYKVFGNLEQFFHDHTKIFMKKKLK